MHDTGKSEYYVKITDFMLSYIRQEYELGNDIASAIEDGEEKDFTADEARGGMSGQKRTHAKRCR